jgi:hypothetical protein
MRLTLLEPEGGITIQATEDALGLVGITIPPERIGRYTHGELLLAYDWAMRQHLRASDNTSLHIRSKPSFLEDT